MPDEHERLTDTAATTTDAGRRGASRRAVEDGDSHGWSPDDLVTEHLWLVDRLAANAARRFPAHTDRHELWSAGVLGLVEASRRFDPNEGVPFAAFASARVRGQIIDQVRSRDLASRRLRRVLRVVVRASEFLAQHLGRVPTLDEISQATGMPPEMVRGALEDLAALTDPTSIDEGTLGDGALVDRAADPGEQLAEAELLGTLREAVDRLPEPLRSILRRSYWEGARLQDIATDMGITFQRVAQYRTEALAALEAWFAHLYDEVQGPDEHGPCRARRVAFFTTMATNSTWRARLAAGQQPPLELAAAPSTTTNDDGGEP